MSTIDLLRMLDPGENEELRQICVQIDNLQGHCKDDNDRRVLQELYRRRNKIISWKGVK